MSEKVLKCLIVDDSRVVRKVALRAAEDLGFECREADNGGTAYELCVASMPDLIILDWRMPGLSGIEFLEKLRLHAEGKNPRVVFCTMENRTDYIKRALFAGADEYIMKPFDGEIIRSKLAFLGLIEH